MDRLFVAIVIIFIVFISLTYLLGRIFRKKRFIKYIPSLISIIFAVINIMLARSGQVEGFRDLARVMMAMLLSAGFLSGLLSALYLDYISPKYKKRNSR